MTLLAEAYPGLLDALPYMQIATLPTPIDSADPLAADLGIRRLWIKRDDRCAKPYGGNKIRKLEYLLADALGKSCDAVLTYGAAGSNHALATAIYARQVGLDCYAVLTGQSPTPRVADTLRYHALLGTRLVPVEGFKAALDARDATMAAHPTGSEKVYEIWWGGSSWLGVAGFVNAALELGQQLAADPPDYVYVAAGSLGTAAGLAIGLRLLGWSTRVVGVRVVPLPARLPMAIEPLYSETCEQLHARDARFPLFDDPLANFELRDEFLGEGYGVSTSGADDAIEIAGQKAGIGLEPTYTGKAMAALVHDARAGRLKGRNAIFWLTYNSYPYPPEIATVDTGKLPVAFQRYF